MSLNELECVHPLRHIICLPQIRPSSLAVPPQSIIGLQQTNRLKRVVRPPT